MKTTLRKNQQGAVLLVGLFLLLVMTLIGVSSMTGANMQEQLAGNTKRLVEARMGAEAGIAEAVATLKAASWKGSALTNWSAKTLKESTAALPYKVNYTVDFNVNGSSVRITSTGAVIAGSPSQTLAQHTEVRTYKYDNCPGQTSGYGLQSKKDVYFNGQAEGYTNVYTGGNITNIGKQIVGDVWANGTIASGTVTGTKYCSSGCTSSEPEGGTPPTIPSVSSEFAALTSGLGEAKDCSGLEGNLQGAKIFCKDGAKMKKSIFNGTLYIDGSLTFIGGSDVGTSGQPVHFVAKGNIDLKGNSNSYYTAWVDGYLKQNGGSDDRGFIKAGGNIEFKGTGVFTADDTYVPPICASPTVSLL